MFCYVWEYEVAPENADAFVAAYGPDGPWARLFRRDPAYLGTELHRDVANPRRFLTIDRWTSRQSCLAFRERAGRCYHLYVPIFLFDFYPALLYRSGSRPLEALSELGHLGQSLLGAPATAGGRRTD